MRETIPSFLFEKPSLRPGARRGNSSFSFLDRAIEGLSQFIRTTYIQWETASRMGLLQKIDARIKILFLLLFVVAVSLKRSVLPELALSAFLMGLVVCSRLSLFQFYRRIFILGGLFGFLIPLPSALNLFTPGEVIFPLLGLSRSYSIWIYHLPAVIGPTYEGLSGVLMLACRVINSLSVTFLVLYTTPFPEIIRGLGVFRFPGTALMVITLTHKYVFLFVRTVQQMHLARKARYAGIERRGAANSWVASRMALMFRRSQNRFEEVYRAMVARGFAGTVKTAPFRRFGPFDHLVGGLLLGAAILSLFI